MTTDPLAAPVTVTVAGLADPVSGAAADRREAAVVVVALTGVNIAVTPLGTPVAERFTVPLNPLISVLVTVALEVPPWFNDSPAAGVALSPTNAGNSTVT